MEKVNRYANFIKRIFSTASAIIRKKLLKSSNTDIILAICEIILNVYNKHLPVSAMIIKKFKKIKKVILKLINKRTSLATRKSLLIDHSETFCLLKEIFA